MALAYAVQLSSFAQERAGDFGTDRQIEHPSVVLASWHETKPAERAGHTGTGSDRLECGILQDPHRRWQVDGIVRPPFGIDQRATDKTGNRSWFVTHLPGRDLAGSGR